MVGACYDRIVASDHTLSSWRLSAKIAIALGAILGLGALVLGVLVGAMDMVVAATGPGGHTGNAGYFIEVGLYGGGGLVLGGIIALRVLPRPMPRHLVLAPEPSALPVARVVSEHEQRSAADE